MVMRSRTVRFTGPRRVDLEDVEVAAPKAGEILVRTLYSGISPGTEMLAYRGELDPSLPLDESLSTLGGTFEYPFSFGYSCVGVVEETRADIPNGTLVFAFHPHQELFVTPAAEAEVLDGIDPRAATLFPLVETALQIALDAGDVFGETVIVAGLGPVGLLTCGLLSLRGATVLGADPLPERRKTADSFGATAVRDLKELAPRVREGGGVPVAIEASGNPDVLPRLLPLLAHEGVALVASWYGVKPVILDLGREFHRRRLEIRSSQVSTIPARLSARWSPSRRRAEARRLMEMLPVKQLATHDFDLSDAARAFSTIDKGEPGLLHAALRYPERHA
jgi:2-desacetyl-2-hydroxyethyl bacteriochlorophyllide A dehydrogenase